MRAEEALASEGQTGSKRAVTSASLPDLKASQNLSFSEDSDLSFDDVLERSSQKSKPSVSNSPRREIPPTRACFRPGC